MTHKRKLFTAVILGGCASATAHAVKTVVYHIPIESFCAAFDPPPPNRPSFTCDIQYTEESRTPYTVATGFLPIRDMVALTMGAGPGAAATNIALHILYVENGRLREAVLAIPNADTLPNKFYVKDCVSVRLEWKEPHG